MWGRGGLLVVLLCLVVSVDAKITSVPCCALAAVRNATAFAAAGDTIQLAAGTYTDCPLAYSLKNMSITIQGAGSGATVIQCNATTYAVRDVLVDNQGYHTFVGLTFRGAGASNPVIEFAGTGALAMRDVVIRQNSVYQSPTLSVTVGAGGNASFTSCQFISNAVQGVNGSAGAALFRSSPPPNPPSRIVLDSCIFYNNSAASGGALQVTMGTNVVMTNTSFTANSATVRSGGAIWINGPTNMNIAGSYFDGNYADDKGGSIAIDHPGAPQITQLTLTSTTIQRGSVSADDKLQRAGGISINGNLNASFVGVNFMRNRNSALATTGGGVSAGRFIINSCVFADNENVESGAAIYHNFQSTATVITNTVFRNNSATIGGAALMIPSPAPPSLSLTISNCTFTQHTATNFTVGPTVAVTMPNNTPLALSSCTFSQNASPGGGATCLDVTASALSLVNTVFDGNSGLKDGALVRASSPMPGGATVTIASCTVRNNAGGRNLIFADHVTTINATLFDNNVLVATDSNVGSLVEGRQTNDNIVLVNSTFTSNTACVIYGAEQDPHSVLVSRVTMSGNVVGGPLCSHSGVLLITSGAVTQNINIMDSVFTDNSGDASAQSFFSTVAKPAVIGIQTNAGGNVVISNVILARNAYSYNGLGNADGSAGLSLYTLGTAGIHATITGCTFSDLAGPMSALHGFVFIGSNINVIDSTFLRLNTTAHAVQEMQPNPPIWLQNFDVFFDGCTFSSFLIVTQAPIYVMAFDFFTMQNCIVANMTSLPFVPQQSLIPFNPGALTLNSFTTNNVVLANNVFRDNFGPVGAVSIGYTNGVTLIHDCNFTNNIGTARGGAISQEAVPVPITVQRCNFIGNSATVGGGIFPQGPGWNVFDSTFLSNTGRNGGAVSGGGDDMNSVNLAFTNCDFFNNHAEAGAAITVKEGTISLDGCQLEGNSVAGGLGYGGAIYIPNQSFLGPMVNTVFRRNTAVAGGALYLATQQACITGGIFEDNRSNTLGGAIASEMPLTITGSTFRRNTGNSAGGAIYCVGDVWQCGAYYEANRAEQGAAVFAASINSTGSIYFNNTALQLGGALYAGRVSAFTSEIFTSNSAALGGAMYLLGTTQCQLTNVTIANNIAFNDGGGIYCDNCVMGIDATSHVTSNAATAGTGGGFYCTSGQLAPAPAVGVFKNNVGGLQSQPKLVYPEVDCSRCGCCSAPAVEAYPNHDCVLYPGVSCNYTCANGYARVYPGGLNCPGAGQSFGPAACVAIQCPSIGGPDFENVIITYTGNITGKQAFFSCPFNYDGSGNSQKSVLCMGPLWDPTPNYQCLPRTCTFASQPANGNLSRLVGTTGDVVDLTCNPGFQLLGARNSTCYGGQTCNQWCPIGSCSPFPCPGVAPQEGRQVKPASAVTGANITVFCDAGYAPSTPGYSSGDVQQSTCILGNYYYPPPMDCVYVPCDDLPAPANGFIVYGFRNSTATYKCMPGFHLDNADNANRQCNQSIWSGVAPSCLPDSCTFPAAYKRIQTNCTTMSFQDACWAKCNAGYTAQPILSVCVGNGQLDPAPGDLDGKCVACTGPNGGFSQAGDTFCTPCINGETLAPTGRREDCQCLEGYFESPIGSGNCTVCVTGAYCAGKKAQPVNAPGYFASDDPLKFYECSPSTACQFNGTCLTGYEGYLCGVCAHGYYKLNGYCYPCPADSGLRIALFIILGLLACTLLVLIAEPSPIAERSYGVASISIAVNFFQIVATFLNTNLKWGSSTQSFFGGLGGFNLNLQLAAPECVYPITFYDKMQAQLLAPFVVAGLMVVVGVVLTIRSWLKMKRPGWIIFRVTAVGIAKSCVAGFFLFMTLAYLTLAKAGFEMFVCNEQVGNPPFYIIATSPSDHCYTTPEWNRNAVLAVFSIIFYVVGTPAMIIAAYMRQRRLFGAGMAGEDILSNFFVGKYKEKDWFWETLVMLRKFVIVIIALYLGGSPFVQAICCVFVFFAVVVTNLLRAPYNWFYHNFAEDASMIACLVVLFSGIATTSTLLSESQSTAADVISVTAVCITIALLAVVLLLELYVFVRVALLLKKHTPQPRVAINVHRNIGSSTGVGRVTCLVNDPSATDSVLSGGSDGRVVALDTSGKEIRPTAGRTLELPNGASAAAMVTVPDSTCLVVCAASEVQLWELSGSQPVCVYTDQLNEEVTCAAMGDKHVLAVGTAGGRFLLYQFHPARPFFDGLSSNAPLASSATVSLGLLSVDDGGASLPRQGSVSSLDESPGTAERASFLAATISANDPNTTARAAPLLPSGDVNSPARAAPPPPSHAPPHDGDRAVTLDSVNVSVPELVISGSGVTVDGAAASTLPQSAGAQARLEQILSYNASGSMEGGIVAVTSGTRFFYSASATVVRRWSVKRPVPLADWTVFGDHSASSKGVKNRTGVITCLEAMGSHIFCGSASGLIYDIDTQTNEIRGISGHTARVNCLVATSGRLFSGGDDGQMRIWNPENDTRLQRLPNSTAGVTAICVRFQHVTWGTADGAVKHCVLDSALDRVKPEVILAPIYKSLPFLRPCGGKRNNKKVLATDEDALGSTDHVALLMEDFSLDQLADEQANRVFVALEDSLARADDKARRVRK